MAPAEIPLLLTLPLLLVASAFFSGSETALFGLSASERMAIRRGGGVGAAAVAALLSKPRALLITLLLCNMTVNVLYFVINSVLVFRAEDAAWVVALSIGPLLLLILFGEVAPKLVAHAVRVGWCRMLSPPLLAVHRVLSPLRRPLEWFVIAPLSRLVRPESAPVTLTPEELSELLSISERQGVLAPAEASLIGAVTDLGRIRVRDIMTPRVDVAWVRRTAGRVEVLRRARDSHRAVMPVCESSLDAGVVGVVNVKRFLASTPASDARATVAKFVEPPLYVPEQARLDGLLERLRARRERFAVVLDEYGGVAGVVTISDVVGRLIAGIEHAEEEEEGVVAPSAGVEQVGPGVWRASGRLSAHDWADAFGFAGEFRVSTLGGLIQEELGRLAVAGDIVRLGNVALTVDSVRRGAIDSVTIRLAEPGGGGAPAGEGGR